MSFIDNLWKIRLKDAEKVNSSFLNTGRRPAIRVPGPSPVEEDVISALVNLGYQRPMAERALAKLGNVSGESLDVLFRKATAALAK
jgi:Holliday junction resolvasome RuvABC DNA-binding subunit